MSRVPPPLRRAVGGHGDHLRVLDLTPALAHAASLGVAVYGRVDRHFSAAGHELTAAALLPYVVAAMRPEPKTARR